MKIDQYRDICLIDTSLRSYQQTAKENIFAEWDEHTSVMLQMPTGTGKTRLFTSIINDINSFSLLKKEPVKILVIAVGIVLGYIEMFMYLGMKERYRDDE